MWNMIYCKGISKKKGRDWARKSGHRSPRFLARNPLAKTTTFLTPFNILYNIYDINLFLKVVESIIGSKGVKRYGLIHIPKYSFGINLII